MTSLRPTRHLVTAALVALTLALSAAPAHAQIGFSLPDDAAAPKAGSPEAQNCGGRDLIQEMKSKEPDRYARITVEAEKVVNTEAILWRVEKHGVSASHLLGTMHLTDPRIATLSPEMNSALAASKTVLLEVADISPQGAASAMLEARHLAFFADGRQLDGLLGAEDYAKAEGLLMRAGIPPAFAPMLRPWLVTLMLASSDCERKAAEAGRQVMDMVVAEAAKQRGLPVAGLESVKSQLESMANIPEPEQIEMLKAAVRSAPQLDDYLETMVQLYLDRKIGATWPLQIALAEQHGVSSAAFEGFKTDIVSKRNRAMHDAAKGYVEKGGAFIAVGALHLVGDDGLVALLRNDGYVVTPVE